MLPRPTSTRSSTTCYDFSFSVQETFSFKIFYPIEDIYLTAELWTPDGKRVASKALLGTSSWNPSGGPTQIELSSCRDLVPGDYNLFIDTKSLGTMTQLITAVGGRSGGRVEQAVRVTQETHVFCKKGASEKVFATKKCPKGWKKLKK